MKAQVITKGLRFSLQLQAETLEDGAHLNLLYRRLYAKGVPGVTTALDSSVNFAKRILEIDIQ